MNPAQQNTTKVVFPIAGLLGVAFIVLKLCGVIDWSWWWVLAPFWGPIALWLVIMIIGAIVIVILAKVGQRRQRAFRRQHFERRPGRGY